MAKIFFGMGIQAVTTALFWDWIHASPAQQFTAGTLFMILVAILDALRRIHVQRKQDANTE